MRPSIPSLPRLLTAPLRLVPNIVHSAALGVALSRLFTLLVRDGEFDFLEDRVLRIAIDDAGIEYRLTKSRGRLVAVDRQQPVAASISGTLYDFLLLATRREDADTLFFQRRLRMEGDTEVGLMVKNLLDGLEYSLPHVPEPIQSAGERAVAFYERFVVRP